MSLENIYKMLQEVGIPVAYHAFEKKQEPPYICYMDTASDNFMADGKVYLKVKLITIELYTRYRDQELEERLEEVMSDLPWQKVCSFVNEEKVYETIYELEV